MPFKYNDNNNNKRINLLVNLKSFSLKKMMFWTFLTNLIFDNMLVLIDVFSCVGGYPLLHYFIKWFENNSLIFFLMLNFIDWILNYQYYPGFCY